MQNLTINGLKILLVTILVLGVAWAFQAGVVKADDPTATEPLGEDEAPAIYVDTDGVTPATVNSVLIALADSVSNATVLQSELLAFGVPTVDLMDVNSSTPALPDLTPYDAVITWAENVFQDDVAMGNVLADYVDQGGRVVMGNFTWFSTLSGRIQDAGYSPFEQAGDSLYSDACLGTFDAGHPIMSGVTSACDNLRDNVIVESGAILVASWDDGRPFVGVNSDCSVVGITSYPGSNRTASFSGDIPLVYYNAVNTSGCAEPIDICTLNLSYGGGNLSIDLTIGTTEAAKLNLYLAAANSVFPLATGIPLSFIDPPFPIPTISFPLPSIGGVVALVTMTRPGEGIICADWDLVNTGSSLSKGTGTLKELRNSLQSVDGLLPSR